MAILKMKRLTLAVIRSQKQELLKELIQHGCVEFSEIDELINESEIANLVKNEGSDISEFRQTHQLLLHSVDILNRYSPQKSKLLSAKPELDGEEFLAEDGLETAISDAKLIEELDDKVKKIAAEEMRQAGVVESLKPWLEFSLPLNCSGTDYAGIMLGTIPAVISIADVTAGLGQATEEAELFEINSDKEHHFVAVVYYKEDLAKVQEALRPFVFSQWTLSGAEGTAAECTKNAEAEIEKLGAEKEKYTNELVSMASKKDAQRLACDKYSAKVSMAEAEEKLFGTQTTVMMEGWMPAENEAALESVFAKYDCAWETRDPEEDEYPQVPVKLKNNKVTSGLNMVTEMYSLPQYGSVDPNPLMAPFFILFYGLMMADIGYGIIMIAAALVALKKIKPREGTLSFCRLLLWCGISTLAMGFVTGGLFSDAPLQIAQMINPDTTFKGLPYLLNPTSSDTYTILGMTMDSSSLVLYGSMVLGLLHMNTGMVVNFVQKVKGGKIGDAIFEEGSLWVILIGIILYVAKIGNVGNIPVVLIVGGIMLLFGAGRHSKGFGKVTAAFGCIYNTLTGWFGDILSYARIMALMLAGGVIGQVFNTVASIPAKSSGLNVFTGLVFVLIFLLGHAMNFALNILGCYVHDLRLQCLEFFNKFYVSGGRAFAPLRFAGKYYNTKE